MVAIPSNIQHLRIRQTPRKMTETTKDLSRREHRAVGEALGDVVHRKPGKIKDDRENKVQLKKDRDKATKGRTRSK